MEHNKTPGTDGLPAKFSQVLLEIIKEDLMAIFKDFHEERLPLYSLNFGVITLLPKIVEANRYNNIDQFVSSMYASRFSQKSAPTG